MTTPAVGWFAGDGSGYGLVEAPEKGIAGGIGAAPEGTDGGATFYVEVEDPPAFLDKAEKTEHITDDYMHARLSQAKPRVLVLLRPTPDYSAPDARQIVWEHGRRNMALQEAAIMPIVCPVGDDELSGIGIFNTDTDQVQAIMEQDPGVRAGIFTFEVHNCLVLAGDGDWSQSKA